MHRSEQIDQMARDRASDSNVIEFPKGDRIRLEQAIHKFDDGDTSTELYKEFDALAGKGLREAAYFLGCMFEDGSNGATKDLPAALKQYEKSVVEFGYVEGYLALARLLYHGDGIEQDFTRAFRYYEHVATKHGHLVACFMLGRMFQRGEGATKDLARARFWYEKSIGMGSVYGMLNLAMLEAEEGRYLRGLFLRIWAGFQAFRNRK
jgi:TPR repeat protein